MASGDVASLAQHHNYGLTRTSTALHPSCCIATGCQGMRLRKMMSAFPRADAVLASLFGAAFRHGGGGQYVIISLLAV